MLEEDLLRVILDVFNTTQWLEEDESNSEMLEEDLLRVIMVAFNTTFIALIPKSDNPPQF
jgi:hypothetical protein